MESRLKLDILPQPDDSTCGPTCLHAVYRYFGDELPLAEVIDSVPMLDEGGTLAVQLGCHALARGYEAVIYTYKLQVFDPTWFPAENTDLEAKLRQQMEAKADAKLHIASMAYLEFLRRGGKLKMEDLTAELVRRYLKRGTPILAGLSATYLYKAMRERESDWEDDDIHGVPVGHFVVLSGYDPAERRVLVADPYHLNPFSPEHHYEVPMHRVISAILLGIVTYDANLLVIQPRRAQESRRAHLDRRQ